MSMHFVNTGTEFEADDSMRNVSLLIKVAIQSMVFTEILSLPLGKK